MADIAALLANAAQTNADFDLGKLNKSYWEGRDQYPKNNLRDAFQGGLPMGPDGQPDIPKIANTFFQNGDYANGMTLLNQATALQNRRDYAEGRLPGQSSQAAPQQPPNTGPPSTSRQAMTPDIAPRNQGGGQPSPQGDQPGSIVGHVSAAGIPDELAGPIIAQLSAQTKTDPNASLDPATSQRVQQVVQAAAQRMKGGQPQQSTGLQPGSAAPMVPRPVQTQAIQPQPPQGFQPSPAQLAAQNDPELKRLRFWAADNTNPQQAAAAKAELDARLKNQELTTTEKDARASRLDVPGYQQAQSDMASEQAGASERAKNDVAEQRGLITQGMKARQQLQTLNTITNVIQTTPNLDLGYGSDTSLKIKMALEKAGWNFGDLSGAQLIKKLNGMLAAESAQSESNRPAQFVFKTFLSNNPGLEMDEKGNIRMLGILSQTAKRNVDLGILARKNQNNWDNWDDVVEKYDRKHPITDPTTGKELSNNSVIAPGPKPTAAASGQKQFSSMKDVDAAVASGQLKRGDSFTDSNGTTRYVH